MGQGGAGRDREGQGGKEAVNHNGFLGQHQQMWEKICVQFLMSLMKRDVST